jgi:hypothetical protein
VGRWVDHVVNDFWRHVLVALTLHSVAMLLIYLFTGKIFAVIVFALLGAPITELLTLLVILIWDMLRLRRRAHSSTQPPSQE